MDLVADTREQLNRNDAEFRRLVHKHGEFKERLAELQSRRHLNDAEQMEEVKLKKLKLALKDQMETMVRQSLARRQQG